jgi:hypothetical protein
MADTALVDGRGCLTPAGVAAFRSAPVGAAPPELALHLASCARCQERMLAAEAAAGRRRGDLPPAKAQPMRTLYLLLAVLLTGAALLLSTYWMLRDRLSP